MFVSKTQNTVNIKSVGFGMRFEQENEKGWTQFRT